jgi:pimeloyl-ACP methyl ester carboxylesterase
MDGERHWRPDGPERGRVALLHGVAASSATWWRIGQGLAARGWSVVALDLPGHGATPRLDRPLDLDVLVSGVVDRLPVPVDLLVGHSLGAVTALAAAARHPGVARALVLEDPPGPTTADPLLVADGIAADTRTVRTDRARLIRRERDANPRWLPQDVEHSVDGIAALDAAAVVAGLRGPLRWDPVALLARVDVPVLVLAAPDGPGQFSGRGSAEPPARVSRDAKFTDDAGSALRGRDRAAVRALLPDDRFVVLDGRHCLHRDLPEQWLDAVSAFADRRMRTG